MEKLPKKYVQCTISVFPLSFPFLFTIKFGVALLHTYFKVKSFLPTFSFLILTHFGKYGLRWLQLCCCCAVHASKSGSGLGLTEGKDPVASLNLGINKQTFEKSNRMPPWNRLHYRTREIGAPKSSMIILRNWKKRFRL